MQNSLYVHIFLNCILGVLFENTFSINFGVILCFQHGLLTWSWIDCKFIDLILPVNFISGYSAVAAVQDVFLQTNNNYSTCRSLSLRLQRNSKRSKLKNAMGYLWKPSSTYNSTWWRLCWLVWNDGLPYWIVVIWWQWWLFDYYTYFSQVRFPLKN